MSPQDAWSATPAWQQPQPPVPQRQISDGERWLVALVLVLGYSASLMQRQTMASSGSFIRETLHFTIAQYSYLFSGFAFGLIAGYLFMTLITALAGARWGLLVSFAGLTIASAGCGLAPGYAGLLITRVLLGFFSAGIVPGAVQAARDWFRSPERPLLIGVMFGLGQAGLIVGTQLFGLIDIRIGWRVTVMMTAVPTLVAAGLCLLFPSAPARMPSRGISGAAFASVGMLLFAGLVASPLTSFLAFSMPTLSSYYGMPYSKISSLSWVTYLASCLSALLAGLVLWALRTSGMKASTSRALLVTIFGCLLPVVAVGAFSREWGVVFIAATLSASAYMGLSALLFSAVADTLPARGVVIGAAAGGLIITLSGLATSTAFGWLRSAGYMAPFLVTGGCAALAMLVVLLLAWLVPQEPVE